jgi:hypothetical protein
MKSPNKFIVAFLMAISVLSLWAQKAEYTSESFFVDFSANSPALVTITSPADLVEKTRGFKKVATNQLTITGTITDKEGIKSVLIGGQNVLLSPSGAFSASLMLDQGDNEIVFDIMDKQNVPTQKVFVVKTEIAAVAAEPEIKATGGNFYALLIGVNDYDDPAIADLDKPIADARALGKVLEQYYTFDPQNIQYIENATNSQIIDALDKIRKVIGPEDNLLLFYAGHGFWDTETETGFWIPSNARKESTSDWYRNTTLIDQLRTIKSKHTLLIADACFSGSIFKSRSVFISEEQVAIKKLYELPSRKAMTSGALTEVPDRSEFMKYLTKRLETNSEKYLPSAELFSSFRRAVINNSDVIPQYGTMQKVGDEGGDFIFIRKD